MDSLCAVFLAESFGIFFLHELLKPVDRLFHLQIAGHNTQAAAHTFGKLLLAHPEHAVEIGNLQIEQGSKAQSHYNGDDNNRSLLHDSAKVGGADNRSK